MIEARFAILPGDGIGPEVTEQAVRVLRAVGEAFGHAFTFPEHPVGGTAIRETGGPLPGPTLAACRNADAVLLGAVGDPEFDDPALTIRPEQALLALRRELGLFANLRPVRVSAHLADAGPLKAEIVAGTDILFVRELTGGIYFGPSSSDGERASSEMVYRRSEVERVVRVAAEAAMSRRKRLTSVDKANVLEVSRLWRSAAGEIAAAYPELDYEVVLVDAMAMHLLARPRHFDVVVTGNLFGDILTDEASVLAGSMGLLPSASLGDGGPGLFEPVHGSAPDLAGKNIANPTAAILSAAMALRHSLGLIDEAAAVEAAVDAAVAAGVRTADVAVDGVAHSTTDVGTAVVAALGSSTGG